MGLGEDKGISLAEELDRSRGFAAAPRRRLGSSRGASKAGRRGAARCWERDPFLCFCYISRLGEVGCMFHGHVELLVLIPPLGWGDRRKVLLPSKQGTQSHFFMGMKASTPSSLFHRKSSSPWSMTSLLVSLFPSATLPWENLPITEQASSLPSGNQTSVCLPRETIACRTWRVFSKPDTTRNTKSGVGAQPASAKCLPNQAGMTG